VAFSICATLSDAFAKGFDELSGSFA